MLIRCSIIGSTQHSRANLFEWYKNASEFGDVEGFVNHLWNGVTTESFARLALALFKEKCLAPGTRQHWVPANFVSKAELLDIFRTLLGRETRVQNTMADRTVDRRLSTLRADQNKVLWAMAGYPEIPSIDKLCQDMVRNLR